VVALKGAHTVVADASGRVGINTSGHPGMATAGSGDVLTGCVAAFLAQGVEAYSAACCGVYLHGKAGELAAHITGEVGMVAGDILSHLPLARSRTR
jgi:NAD(P)H-hydrate epimerase